MVVSDTYDAEIETSVPLVRDNNETRRSKQHLKTFGRDINGILYFTLLMNAGTGDTKLLGDPILYDL